MSDSTTTLTDIERAILDFEAGPSWHYVGAKEDEIRRRFGMSPTRFHQILNVLLDNPAALAYKPVLINRLHRLRDARRAHRRAG